MDSERVGNYIAQQRKLAGLTQQQLAERIGLTNKAVSKWETGEGLPDICILLPLAETLETTVDNLLKAGGSGGRAKPKQATGMAWKAAAHVTMFILTFIIIFDSTLASLIDFPSLVITLPLGLALAVLFKPLLKNSGYADRLVMAGWPCAGLILTVIFFIDFLCRGMIGIGYRIALIPLLYSAVFSLAALLAHSLLKNKEKTVYAQ